MNSLILGGIKSGKSRLAEHLASDSGKSVVLLATASVEQSAGDPEMSARIQRHQKNRARHWTVVEEPLFIGNVICDATANDIVIVDCLTLWLTNLLMQKDNSFLNTESSKLLKALQSTPAQVILVSNETSMGIIPMGELTRRFCDEAGTLHQQLSAVCDQVVLCIAGLPHVLKGIPINGHQQTPGN